MDSFKPQNIRVALLAGGISGERVISLASGKGAFEALTEAGFSVTMLDPSSKDDLKTLIDGGFDIAFICLHGKYGEDGTIQGMLEILGMPYIGSNVWSSALAIDKAKSKIFYERAGIKTPRSINLLSPDDLPIGEILSYVGQHCVVKPSTEGSALGVFIVEGEEQAREAINKAFSIDTEVLVETFVSGTELTVAVLGNEDPEPLPIIEIVPVNEFYDYESKYAPGGSQHICPARLDAAVTEKVQAIAVAAHKALECSGVSRTDIIMDDEGECWTLETNTIPGMTGTSLLPDAGRAAGISFPELCTRLVELGLERTR
ncbi:MAG: D-alanine--D-alanine ligase [Raoultibacter sp.]